MSQSAGDSKGAGNCPLIEESAQYPGLEIVHTEVREQLTRQLDDIDGLGTKAGLIAGFNGAMLAGLFGAIDKFKDIFQTPPNVWVPWALWSIITLITLLMLVSLVLALRAYQVRKYAGVIDPRGTYEELVNKSTETVKLELVYRWIEDYEINSKAIDKKAALISGSLNVLLAALILVALALILWSAAYSL